MPAPAYRLQRLRVDFGGHTVLDVPSLEIGAGRVTVVVGSNGAGKTTLLRVLAMLLTPSAGQLEFQGHRVEWRERSLHPLRAEVTLVAQAPLLFRRSVKANVAYGLRRRGLEADGRVEEALSKMGLQGFGPRSAWKLSGGETQRVAIARALAIDPPVYLLDEPAANIDRANVPVVEEIVRSLAARGRTVVMTTHNAEQAARLSDTTVFLESGRIAGMDGDSASIRRTS